MGRRVAEQTSDVFAKLERLLAGVDSERSRFLSASIHLADLNDMPEFDSALNAWIGGGPQHWPQRTCVGSALVAPISPRSSWSARAGPPDRRP